MNVAFAELEEASTAVYVTMVSPIEKVDPELWLDVKFTLPELSLVVGSDHVTTAVDEPTSVLWTISDGILLITGISSSMEKCYEKNRNTKTCKKRLFEIHLAVFVILNERRMYTRMYTFVGLHF